MLTQIGADLHPHDKTEFNNSLLTIKHIAANPRQSSALVIKSGEPF